MPAPTPENALLNRLFETHHNPPPVPPLTLDQKVALESFEFGLHQALGAQTCSTASTPSTSTLASLCEADPRTPRPLVNDSNGGNQPIRPKLTHNRSFSVDELNPNAEPFVPSFLPHPAPAPSAPVSTPTSNSCRLLRPVPDGTLPTLIPRWLRTFRRAMSTTTNTMSEHDVLAMVIVNSERWDSSEAMAELAQEFAWHGTEKVPPEQAVVVATFAQEVYRKFRDMRGEEYGGSFLWQLKEAVLGTYMNVWDANNNPEAISSQWIPSLEYIRVAIALGAFIGDLFTQGMVTCSNMTACLNKVMENLVAFEHVEAIQELIVHAGPTYWFFSGEGSEGLRRFEGLLLFLADQLHDQMSVVRRTLGPGEVKKAVGGIVMKCDMWLEELQVALGES